MPAVFVDRDDSMAELTGLGGAVAGGRGEALVISGDSGIGKSSLLAEFHRRAAADDELSGCRYVQVRCRPGIGPGNSCGPVLDALLALRPLPKPEPAWRRWGRGLGRGATQAAPDVLSLLVPGIAPLVSAGRGITGAALDSGSVPGDSLLMYQQVIAARLAEALLSEARSGPPVVVLLDDVQYIDLTSLQVLEKLLDSLAGEPLGVVLGHGRYAGGAAGSNAEAVDALLDRWEEAGLLRRHTLPALPRDAVAELVDLRFPGGGVPRTLPLRLAEATGGSPVFVEQCLQLWRPADGDVVTFPRTLPAAVKERFDRLDSRSRELLVIAATQGESFLTRPVAEVAGVPHGEAMEHFRRIASEHGLIRPSAALPDWARYAGSDGYDFAHRALQRTVQAEQGPVQAEGRHSGLAAALQAIADSRAGDEDDVPLELRLAIADQLRKGGPRCCAASADAHHALARYAAVKGLSFAEAEQHCEVAIAAARALPPAAEGRDRRLVEAVELLLSLTEVRWRGHASPGGGQHIDALAQEAEAAAARLADRALVARTTLLRGKTLLVTEGLEPSLEKLREAVERAGDCGDDGKVALFIAMVEYGRQLPKRDLRAGLQVLAEAEELYASEESLGASGDPVLQHARNLNEMQLGVNLFDAGHLSEGRTRLLRCTDRLRGEPLRAELPIALNYLAQLHIAMGEEAEAAVVLREARGFEEERGGDSGWHAYNTALLAQLTAREPGRLEEALALIEEAWGETERTWLANLVPIVRNLYAEVLCTAAGDGSAAEGAVGEPPGVLERAHRLAEATCAETSRTGMVRSEIGAYSLRGRIRLRQGDVAAAVSHARRAVGILEEVGDMPALRTEEVYFHASRALRAGGASEDAGRLLERARAEVSRKAGLIDDPQQRERFLRAVVLNRDIIKHAEDPTG